MVAFAVRGALPGMEVVGRRAAWSVLSELRLALVEKRLRPQPVATDGTTGAEIAAVAVQGVEALEGYFARYLPQVVLACVVPLLVVAWVAVVDCESALIMLFTLPLVPVFMWLIGRYTEERTRERCGPSRARVSLPRCRSRLAHASTAGAGARRGHDPGRGGGRLSPGDHETLRVTRRSRRSGRR